MIDNQTSMTCDRCGSQETKPLFDNHDYISDEAFAIVQCTECGLVRTHFPYDLAELGRYYSAAYYGTAADGKRFIGPMEWLIAQFRNQRVQAVLNAHEAHQATVILDLGCGRGLILQALQKQGWQCHGTELSETLAQSLAKQNIQIYTQPELTDANLPESYFDMITMWHSLEHMPHPVQTIAEIARILKPGGKLLLEVPNLASWQARIGGGRWFHLDSPRHLYHFTPSQLEAIFIEHGLSLLKTETLSLEQGFYGMYQSCLNRLTTENNVLYSLLKKHMPKHRGLKLVWNSLITAIGLIPVVVIGTDLEIFASLKGQGAVIQMVVEKPIA
jgi:2-polyprenyl-3-methyl-5-hydroxy-6-metoxy-1,4-benzoquinol methylase